MLTCIYILLRNYILCCLFWHITIGLFVIAKHYHIQYFHYQQHQHPHILTMEHAGSISGDEDHLTECGICLSEIEKPKALPCLHTFCLQCLRTYATGKTPPSVITCPLCRENIPLPFGGVDGFRDNFYIHNLRERRVICKAGVIRKPCASCGEDDRKIIARCLDCNGFLCQSCVDLHKKIGPLKVHKVVTIEDLRAGKVDINTLTKDQCCEKHKDQVLRFFCHTCGIPICHVCTVVEHRHPEHDFVTLEDAVKNQMTEIKKLAANCQKISQQVDEATTNGEKVKKELKKAITTARKQLDYAKEKKKTEFLKALEEDYKSSTDKLNKIETGRCDEIDSNSTTLQNIQSKLNNAMEVANQLIKSGSKHDVATNYTTLTTSLSQLQDIQVTSVSNSLSKVRFTPDQQSEVTSVNLGLISHERSWEGNGKWVLEKEIGKDRKGKIKYGHGIAIRPNRDVVITDINDKNIKVFHYDGKLKQVLDQGDLQCPYDVTVSSTGQYYVTDHVRAYVKVYSPDGKYLMRFTTMSPTGQSSDADNSLLLGMDIDDTGYLFVGSNNMYISKHALDGSHKCTIKVGIIPHFLAVTSKNIIVSTNQMYTGVQILDHNGNHLHTINAPNDAKSWYPHGVCCPDDDIIYISSWDSGDKGGIYSFTMEGEYQGCVTTDVTRAHGIAMTDDDKLVVAQGIGNPVRVFSCV